MEEVVDGDYQNYKAKGGAYTREHFFGKYPELREMVANMSDDDIWRLNRGGHDPQKVYAAYAEAAAHEGQPTVILAKTVKGYGMGEAGEGRTSPTSSKKMARGALKAFRDRFASRSRTTRSPRRRSTSPPEDSPELRTCTSGAGARRLPAGAALGRRAARGARPLESLRGPCSRAPASARSRPRWPSCAPQLLTARQARSAAHVVPIVPDEARTFGMEGCSAGSASTRRVGQLYEPVDSDQVSYYREEKHGQILAGGHQRGRARFVVDRRRHGVQQPRRQHDPVLHLLLDVRLPAHRRSRLGGRRHAMARGFLLGGTSGRTTLGGEGLQHQDGHSHVLASTIPELRRLRPAYAYELAVIMHDGLRRMFAEQENVFYYITVMNENYPQPRCPRARSPGS